ncbi:MAG: alpha/beta family hydrolase [Candidatus Eisenbacteria bacterium]
MGEKAHDARAAGTMGAQYTRRDVRIRVDATTTVSGVLAAPAPGAGRARAAVVLGHGEGADMTNAFLCAVHEGLAERGALVLKFDFAYTEAGRRAPDPPARLLATYRAAVAWIDAQPAARGLPRILCGKSMGGRIASHVAAAGDPADGLLFLGYPLHPAGRPDKLRDAHLAQVQAPMLFIAGTRDPLCDLELLAPVLARLGRRATLAVIADGDHSFHVRKSSGRDDAAATGEVIAAAAQWITRRKPLALKAPRRAGAARATPSPPPPTSRPKRSPGAWSSSARDETTPRR